MKNSFNVIVILIIFVSLGCEQKELKPQNNNMKRIPTENFMPDGSAGGNNGNGCDCL